MLRFDTNSPVGRVGSARHCIITSSGTVLFPRQTRSDLVAAEGAGSSAAVDASLAQAKRRELKGKLQSLYLNLTKVCMQ